MSFADILDRIFDQTLKTELENIEAGVALSLPGEQSTSEASPTQNMIENMVLNAIPVPALPTFPCSSPAPQPQRFTVPLGEKGFSFIQVTVNFLPLQMPAYRAHVKVLLECIVAYPRRISSVALSLGFPNNNIEDLHPTIELGPETTTDVKTTHNTAIAFDGGIGFQATSVMGGRKRKIEEVQSATRITQMKIIGFVKDTNTACWYLTEDVGQGGQGGLPTRVPKEFTLAYKPGETRFQCRVTSVKDGKEKVKYASQKHRTSSFFENILRFRGP